MGVLNVTPDSFSDGGRFSRPDDALAHAERMAGEGADIIDVGGESTRPGASPVDADDELRRVVPVIEKLAVRIEAPVSVDTSSPRVMRAAVAAGAAMINDVRALRADGALEAAVELAVPVCLVHMRGEPQTMQRDPRYADVVREVRSFLLERARRCEEAGVARGDILIDPGFGFGKTVRHNLALLRGLGALAETGFPVVAGLSRKAMIASLVGRPVAEPLAASLALGLEAAARGARVLRVHDVAATRDALTVAECVSGIREPS